MRKLLLAACSLLIFGPAAFAQNETPRWELTAGATAYLAGGEFASLTPTSGTFSNPGQLPGEGFQIGVSRSIRSYFRLAGEVNQVWGKELLSVEHLPVGGQYKAGNEFMAVVAPEATYRKLKYADVFVHYVIGLSHAVDNQVPAVANNSATSWIHGVGFGVDIKTGHRFAIRLIEADWITSHFNKQDYDAEDNWRYTAGVVFRFGKVGK